MNNEKILFDRRKGDHYQQGYLNIMMKMTEQYDQRVSVADWDYCLLSDDMFLVKKEDEIVFMINKNVLISVEMVGKRGRRIL